MQTRPLEIPCPACGSLAVFYSCTPACCFNHVCEDCHSTFEPVTHATGQHHRGATPPEPLPDSTQPTAACAKCDATTVYRTPEGDALICTTCAALLTLELTEVFPG